MSRDLTPTNAGLPTVDERGPPLRWLRELVAAELMKLLALGLRGAPSGMLPLEHGEEADLFDLTVRVWFEDIVQHWRELEPDDGPRLREGFAELRRRCGEWWPRNPVMLHPCVPPRPVVLTAEERASLEAVRARRREREEQQAVRDAEHAAKRAERARLGFPPLRTPEERAAFKARLQRMRGIVQDGRVG